MSNFFTDYVLFSTLKYTGVDIPLGAILCGLTLGLSIAAFAVYFHKKTMHLILKRLLRAKAYTADCAKSVSELRLGSRASVLRMLSGGGKLRSIVKDTKGTGSEIKYYIPEEKQATARRVYEEGAPSLISTVFFALMILFVGVGLLLLLPIIFSLL